MIAVAALLQPHYALLLERCGVGPFRTTLVRVAADSPKVTENCDDAALQALPQQSHGRLRQTLRVRPAYIKLDAVEVAEPDGIEAPCAHE